MSQLTEGQRLAQHGVNRFHFGYALPGETLLQANGQRLTMLGNFARKHLAKVIATQEQAVCIPYLFGKLKRGWSVFKVENPL